MADPLAQLAALDADALRRELLALHGLVPPLDCTELNQPYSGSSTYYRAAAPGVWFVIRPDFPGWSGYVQFQATEPTDCTYAHRYGGCFAEEVLAGMAEDLPELVREAAEL